MVLSQRPFDILELLPFNQRTPVEDSSLSGGLLRIVSVPVELTSFQGIASNRPLVPVEGQLSAELRWGSDQSMSSDSSGIAPGRFVGQVRIAFLPEGYLRREELVVVGISKELTGVGSNEIPGRINSSTGDLH